LLPPQSAVIVSRRPIEALAIYCDPIKPFVKAIGHAVDPSLETSRDPIVASEQEDKTVPEQLIFDRARTAEEMRLDEAREKRMAWKQ
jgi:hypothetical protein